MTDYRRYYDLEKHLLDTVGPNFRKTGLISPLDFYLILIWKANRAKNYVQKRFSKKGMSFKVGVTNIARELYGSSDCKTKLEILMRKWGFLLPTATAILTILYPDNFSVYDARIVEQIKNNVGDAEYFEKMRTAAFSSKLWDNYQRYLDVVRAMTPQEYSLRDKDRFLWAKSLIEDAQRKVDA